MKFYITSQDSKFIKRQYSKIVDKTSFVINTINIVNNIYKNNHKLFKNDDFDDFIITDMINKLLKKAYDSKKYNSILYVVEEIDRIFIYSFKKYLKSNNMYIASFNLLDYYQTLDQKIYKFFDEVY